MRTEITTGDRVRLIGPPGSTWAGMTGTVRGVAFDVQTDGNELVIHALSASELERVVAIDSEEFTAETRAQAAAADAAIQRAQAMLAIAIQPSPRRELLGELGELAGELADLVPGISGAMARKIAALATRLALLLEREASR